MKTKLTLLRGPCGKMALGSAPPAPPTRPGRLLAIDEGSGAYSANAVDPAGEASFSTFVGCRAVGKALRFSARTATRPSHAGRARRLGRDEPGAWCIGRHRASIQTFTAARGARGF